MKPSLIAREREYQLEKLALAMALRGAPRTPGNAHLWAPQACWGGRTWVEWIIEQYGHLAADLVNRAVKRGEQQRMFGEDGGSSLVGKVFHPSRFKRFGKRQFYLKSDSTVLVTSTKGVPTDERNCIISG